MYSRVTVSDGTRAAAISSYTSGFASQPSVTMALTCPGATSASYSASNATSAPDTDTSAQRTPRYGLDHAQLDHVSC